MIAPTAPPAAVARALTAPAATAPEATTFPAAWESEGLVNVDYWNHRGWVNAPYRSTALRVGTGDDYRLIGSAAPISKRDAKHATASQRFLDVGASYDDAIAAAKALAVKFAPDTPSPLIGVLQAANGNYFLTGLGVWARFRGLLTPKFDSESIEFRNRATTDLKAVVQTSTYNQTKVYTFAR